MTLNRPPAGRDPAVVAAAQVACRLGLGETQPRVLAVGGDIVIALEPLPIIARVGPLLTDRQLAGQRRVIPPPLQVELAAYAAARGGPVVSPLPGAGAGPHVIGELTVTLRERSPNHPITPAAVGRSLRRLHEVIAGFGGDLPSFDRRPDARRIAEELPASAHETAVILRATCDAYQPTDLPNQPLHGDVHIGNALGGASGPQWNDFEYACSGPIEWDLAGAAHRATVFGEQVDQTRALLAAYGDDAADRDLVLTDAVGLHMAAQTAGALDARPALRPLAERRLEWVRQRLG